MSVHGVGDALRRAAIHRHRPEAGSMWRALLELTTSRMGLVRGPEQVSAWMSGHVPVAATAADLAAVFGASPEETTRLEDAMRRVLTAGHTPRSASTKRLVLRLHELVREPVDATARLPA